MLNERKKKMLLLFQESADVDGAVLCCCQASATAESGIPVNSCDWCWVSSKRNHLTSCWVCSAVWELNGKEWREGKEETRYSIAEWNDIIVKGSCPADVLGIIFSCFCPFLVRCTYIFEWMDVVSGCDVTLTWRRPDRHKNILFTCACMHAPCMHTLYLQHIPFKSTRCLRVHKSDSKKLGRSRNPLNTLYLQLLNWLIPHTHTRVTMHTDWWQNQGETRLAWSDAEHTW